MPRVRPWRPWLVLLAAGLLQTPGPARASDPVADYPGRPVKIVVPFPPGGTTDMVIRVLGPRMARALGQPVVVENRAGAAATVGANYVSRAAPDGYTLLAASSHHPIAQHVLPWLGYRLDVDLMPVGMLALAPSVVVVNSTVAARSALELVSVSQGQPDRLNYASAGMGSAHYLIGELFKQQTGAQLTHIPYRGTGPALADLLGGQVSVLFDTVSSALPYIRAGMATPLAVTTARRSSALPAVPTLAEAGVPGIDLGIWFGLMAPVGTPGVVVDRLNREILKALADPQVQQQFLALGIESMTSTPGEMGAQIRRELLEYGELVRKTRRSAP
jgi:tripartite-type tricarboxylate transporter receptor subunit TctC